MLGVSGAETFVAVMWGGWEGLYLDGQTCAEHRQVRLYLPVSQ